LKFAVPNLKQRHFKGTVPSIVLKSGQVGRPRTQPTRGWNWVGFKKKQGKKKPDVTWLTRSKTWLQPVDFCFFFFIKTTSFWFKKKLTRTTWWSGQNLVTRSKLGTRVLDLSGSENYGYFFFFLWKLGTPPAKGKFCHTTPTRQWHEDQRSDPVSADVPPQPRDR
jgi:hypothetical protein